MESVEAYMCPHCTRLYYNKEKAEGCEKECNRKRTEEEMRKESRKKRQELNDFVRLNAESVSDIEEMMKKVSREVMVEDGCYLEDVTLDVRYSESVSNSHSCPLDGVHNWHGKDDLPLGYPGFSGRIKGKWSKRPAGFRSDSIRNVSSCIHTGCGGGDGLKFKYDVRIYLSDFPKLKSKVEEILSTKDDLTEIKEMFVNEVNAKVASCKDAEEIENQAKCLRQQIDELQSQLLQTENTRNKLIQENYVIPKQEEYERTLKAAPKEDFGIRYPHWEYYIC